MKTSNKLKIFLIFVLVLLLFFLMILFFANEAVGQTGWVYKGEVKEIKNRSGQEWQGKTNALPQDVFGLILITNSKNNFHQVNLTIHHPDSSVEIRVSVYDNKKTNKKSFNIVMNRFIENKKSKKLDIYFFDRKQKNFLDLFPKSHPAFEFLLKKIKDGCGKIKATKR